MSRQAPIDRWLSQWQGGRESAARRICALYESQLLALARRRMRGCVMPMVDEHDVVSQTLHSFLRRARGGAFMRIASEDDLRKLLCRMLRRKVINEVRYHRRSKRDAASPERLPRSAARAPGWERLADPHISPALQVSLQDWLQHLLERLEDQELRQLALLRLQGYTQPEIAVQLRRSLATVERRLRLIRDIWQEEYGHEPGDPAVPAFFIAPLGGEAEAG